MTARSAGARAGDLCHVCGADVTQGWWDSVDSDEARCVACGAPSTATLTAPRVGPAVAPHAPRGRVDRRIARILERAAWKDVVALHDVRVPGTQMVLHDVAVARSGVYVVDARSARGLVEERLATDGQRRERRLLVGGRDCSHWAAPTLRKATALQAVLDPRTPVRGVLCVLDAEWRLAPRPIVCGQVVVVWPRALARLVSRPGPLTPAAVRRTAERLAAVSGRR